jgi:proton glutamate symport protein
MRRLKLTHYILLAMVLGIVVGAIWPALGVKLQPLETIFLRLIKVIVGPLIFSTIVVGIAGQRDLRSMGRIGLKAAVYFEVVTTIALFLGVGIANLLQPGRGISLGSGPASASLTVSAQPPANQSWVETMIEHIVPQSFAEALARGEVLQVVVFSVIFGIAVAGAGARGRPVLVFTEGLAQVMFRFTDYVMWFAPLGVFGALAAGIGGHGLRLLLPLLRCNLTFYAALLLFVFGVLIPVLLLARFPLRRFTRAVQEPALLAFSSASSEAALPSAIENMERAGVPPEIAGFVIPAGYSFNTDGSTLYLAFATLFVAQAGGVHLTIGRQLLIVATLMLTSKGVAGVARGVYPILAAAAASFGLPLEGVALLLAVDQFMDMGRTTINVLGNCTAAAVVARWEGRTQFKAVKSGE